MAQKIVILLWMLSVVAITARPPWTVHTTAHYNAGAVDDWGTATAFRWFFATPEWETYAEGEPGTLKFSGKLRFDLLALEMFITSAIAGGLLIVLAPARRS
jgi:hypothetical protein